MKRLIIFILMGISLAACNNQPLVKTSITKAELQDKIKGGWAGQVIGCTFGGPTEFKFKGSMINDYQPIPWDEDRCLWYFQNAPGLYDDVYMDLTFVDVFEKEGIDAPASSHAKAFAEADYMLWHANQAARYNVLNGIPPPESGFWKNNPHSDDIDFQIEADFAGLMSPGMVNQASEICDEVGHIMNYGDGWYGGVYVAAMYSLAFISDDVNYVVAEALKAIPAESQFYKCIRDVINWHNQFPDDWKRAWFETEKKWSADVGCPDGVFKDFDIDAKINAAYIVIGLLYGEGDYSKTMEISTRCGQDSDCNPASAGGILGTMMGYSNIPEMWKKPVYPVEDMDFRYTTMSLNDVYAMSYSHALQVLKRNEVNTENEILDLPIREIKSVELEQGFEGHYPKNRDWIGLQLTFQNPEKEIYFEGNGFVLTGGVSRAENISEEAVLSLEIMVDDGDPEQFTMPYSFSKRRHDVAWKYQLEDKPHKIVLRLLEPVSGFWVDINELLSYSSEKNDFAWVKD